MKVSFQLYSARNFTPWEEVLVSLKELGYTHVEGFGGVYEDCAGFRQLLDKHDLVMASGHFSLDALENDFDTVLENARTLGISQVFCPFLQVEDRPTDEQGWIEIAHRLEAIGAKVKAAGMAFGWHNHEFELVALSDASIPMKTILDHAPSIDWEADIAWVVRGGGDPLEWIDQYGDRISSVHVKDIAAPGDCTDEDGWADVGHGVMDWSAIMRKLKNTKNELYIMEHDNPSDHQRFASRSFASFKNL